LERIQTETIGIRYTFDARVRPIWKRREEEKSRKGRQDEPDREESRTGSRKDR